jgi:hypothetical protein
MAVVRPAEARSPMQWERNYRASLAVAFAAALGLTITSMGAAYANCQ